MGKKTGFIKTLKNQNIFVSIKNEKIVSLQKVF